MKNKSRDKPTSSWKVKTHMENLRKFHASAQPGRCYSLAEIARGVGVSGESVRKWQEAALMKLRKRLSSYEFKEMGIDLKEFIKLK